LSSGPVDQSSPGQTSTPSDNAADTVDAVIIGAGVVGLAVARAVALELCKTKDAPSVYLLERESAIGTQTSSRNSEVIHAGIYYPKGSLKAALCVQGRHLLYKYLTERALPHKRLGKLIVATNANQDQMLAGIMKKAQDNGVNDLELLTQHQVKELEPDLFCTSALLSPSTGILDTHSYMLSLQGDFENAGGTVIFQTEVLHAKCSNAGVQITTQNGDELHAKWVINCCGINAPLLAQRFEGSERATLPGAYYAKGNYFLLKGKSPFKRLIYPVPEAAGLGVHLTLDLGGQVKFGPDVEWVEDPTRLEVSPERGERFYSAVRKYWPGLADGDLIAGYAGIRPKINSASEPSADFMMCDERHHKIPGLIHLMGIESPGITSSLAIADEVLSRLRG
jgi:L-2-hydroxyglutarate oxidase LhgO